MRKSALLFTSILFLSFNITAYGNGLNSGPIVACDYVKYATMFGVSNISEDFVYSDKDQYGDITLYVDDFAVCYNADTFKPDSYFLFLTYEGYPMSDQIMKANAFFAAIESDETPDPLKLTFENGGDILIDTIPIFNDMCNIIKTNSTSIAKGDKVMFHKGGVGTYYLKYDNKVGYIITSEVIAK